MRKLFWRKKYSKPLCNHLPTKYRNGRSAPLITTKTPVAGALESVYGADFHEILMPQKRLAFHKYHMLIFWLVMNSRLNWTTTKTTFLV